MNRRSRIFLLILTFIACLLVHAPLVRRTHAASARPRVVSPQAIRTPKASAANQTTALTPWMFNAAPSSLALDLDSLWFIDAPARQHMTRADADAMASDLALLVEQEFALTFDSPEPGFRAAAPIDVARFTSETPSLHVDASRLALHVSNEAPPAFAWINSAPLYSTRAIDVSVRISARDVVVDPPVTNQRPGGPPSSGSSDPPPPVASGGLGGLPLPSAGLPEPDLLLPILMPLVLMRRRRRVV